jgi:hypothetical protein
MQVAIFNRATIAEVPLVKPEVVSVLKLYLSQFAYVCIPYSHIYGRLGRRRDRECHACTDKYLKPALDCILSIQP